MIGPRKEPPLNGSVPNPRLLHPSNLPPGERRWIAVPASYCSVCMSERLCRGSHIARTVPKTLEASTGAVQRKVRCFDTRQNVRFCFKSVQQVRIRETPEKCFFIRRKSLIGLDKDRLTQGTSAGCSCLKCPSQTGPTVLCRCSGNDSDVFNGLRVLTNRRHFAKLAQPAETLRCGASGHARKPRGASLYADCEGLVGCNGIRQCRSAIEDSCVRIDRAQFAFGCRSCIVRVQRIARDEGNG